ncbi:serine hydrolase domain-containing protein [Flavobacterium sp.]|jgi:CubicO group peptidase (beta-lactamase class C family)|uniref:serine hydrolase domain-containing protein n=1 Tax=Flavobacterium sp. TaxID=239 RepID=UPI0037BF250E
MKRLLAFFKWFLISSVGFILILYIFDVDYLLRAVKTIYLKGHTTAFLEDYKEFPNRTIQKGTAQPWAVSKAYNSVPATDKLTTTHKNLQTVAFLIIKNDSIWHESYFDGYTNTSKSNSFSIAKSIVSAALGKAIMQGKIKSLDQKVTDFFPKLKGKFAKEVTVGDLSSMASGLSWDEKYYSPFSIVTRAYFDDQLKEVILGLSIKDKPGQEFRYLSGATQLLAMCIEKATGEYLSNYVSEHFWKPMGAENEALWQLDEANTGIEKAYCCIASTARDFARFGKLYKQNGVWNGKQILPRSFVEKSLQPRFSDSPEYGYGWWLHQINGKRVFYMRGHLGQFVIVLPEDDVIIVRLGHLKGKQTTTDPHSNDLYVYVEEALKMINKKK